MRIFRCLLILTFFVLIGANDYADDSVKSSRLELKMKELKDSSLFPGAKAYSATFTNTTAKTISLELVQYTPGYLGGRTVYPCSVQLWNWKAKQWQTVPPGIGVPNTVSVRSSIAK